MPVVEFYVKGLTNEELSRVSFVCTCTLKEDMDRVSKELNLNLDTDTWISERSVRKRLPSALHVLGCSQSKSSKSSPVGGGICGWWPGHVSNS